MSKVTITNLVNATLPFSTVSVKKASEGFERYRGLDGNDIIFEAATDGVSATYFATITDANGCFHTASFTLSCTNTGPEYGPSGSVDIVQPQCINGGMTPGYVRFYNMQHATRYKLCDNTGVFNCSDCASSDGVINQGSDTIVYIFPPDPGQTKFTTIRIYNGPGCDLFLDATAHQTSPICGGSNPSLVSSVLQPYCDGSNNIVNGTLRLTQMSNATRFKICPDTTVFNCSDCAVSDGTISGSSIDISLPAPAAGLSRNGVVRVFNGSGCSNFTDVPYQISSPICDGTKISMIVLDYNISASVSTNCSNPSVDYDMYVTPNTVGMSENGQKSQVRGGVFRNLPNGVEVPDVLISAAIFLACGPGPFYRWAFNISLLKAKYPAINVFTFDIYAEKIKGTTGNNLIPQTNTFSGVRMIKQLYGTSPVGSNDAYRDPLYPGTFTAQGVHTYDTGATGFRKVGTIAFNVSANTVTFTNV